MKVLKYIDFINEWVGKVFSNVILIIMLLAIYEVIRRYFFSNPTTWVWEINSHLMCLMGAMAGGYTYLKGSHVSVDILTSRLQPRTRAILSLATAPFFFIFVGCLIWFGAKEAIRSYAVDLRVISQFASPLWPVKSVIPLGGILIFLQGLSGLIRNIRILAEVKEQ